MNQGPIMHFVDKSNKDKLCLLEGTHNENTEYKSC